MLVIEIVNGLVAFEMGIQGPVTVGAFSKVPVPVQVIVRLLLFWEMPIVTQLTVTVNLHVSMTPVALLPMPRLAPNTATACSG